MNEHLNGLVRLIDNTNHSKDTLIVTVSIRPHFRVEYFACYTNYILYRVRSCILRWYLVAVLDTLMEHTFL